MYDQGYPYQVSKEQQNTVYICQCGHTQNPPYCDGSHSQHAPAKPARCDFGDRKSLFICGCGQSKNKPFCDGSHNLHP